MRLAVSLLAVTVSLSAAHGQTEMPAPVDRTMVHRVDSGVVEHDGPGRGVAFRHDVRIDGAAWLRLHFADVDLGDSSTIRMTSLLDGEVQELDLEGVRMWRHGSAYFNGSSVRLEVVAPAGVPNRVVLEMLSYQTGAGQADGGCGICGGDDREPSFEDFAGRLMPAGCSATIYSDQSCIVTAGHCVSGGGAEVMQFRVPASGTDCTLVHPPVSDQFPIVDELFENAGPGHDWGVLRAGYNDLGELPYGRYQALRPIAQDPVTGGATLSVWAYGDDTECERNRVQQHSTGTVGGVATLTYLHDVDTTFGASGSSLQNDAGEIVAIATHCNCPSNVGQRVDVADFRAARLEICGCIGDINLDGEVGVTDILKVLSQWGDTGSPSADVNRDGIVDVADLLIVLSEWGPC